MKEFTGADLIADALAQLHVEHVFAIVSIHNCRSWTPSIGWAKPKSSTCGMSKRVPMLRMAMPELAASLA